MNGMERYRGPSNGLSRPGQTPAPHVGPSQDLSNATFTRTVIAFDDLPSRFVTPPSTDVALFAGRAAADNAASSNEIVLRAPQNAVALVAPGATGIDVGTVYACAARQLDKPRRVGERIVQRRIGWQATPKAIIVTVVDRPLRKRPDGKMEPEGEWGITTRHTYPARRAPRRTTGSLPSPQAETMQSSGAGSNGSGHGSGGSNAGLGEGASVSSYLPTQVRSSMLSAVPTASIFDGDLIQWSRDGAPTHVEASVLRIGADRATVVKAVRQHGADVWETTQVDYLLDDPVVESLTASKEYA